MFERFTAQAREVVVNAQSIARDREDRQIAQGHLLLGLLQDAGIAQSVLEQVGATLDAVASAMTGPVSPVDDAEALGAIGIDLAEVRRRTEETFGAGALERSTPRRRALFGGRAQQHLAFTRGAKDALSQSLRAALDLDHTYIGTEHLLLGVLTSTDTSGQELLQRAGAPLDERTARQAIRAHLRRAA